MSFAAAAGLPHHRDRIAATGPEKGTVNWRTVRRVLAYTRPNAGKRNAIFTLTVVRAIQKPALAWALGAVVNGPITGGSWTGAIWGAIGFFILALFTEVTFHFRQRLAVELGESVVHDLRRDLYLHLQRMPLSYFNKTKLGRILSRVITDIEAVRRGVQQVFFFSILILGQMAGTAALMLYNNAVLFGVLLVLAPIIWLAHRFFHPRLSRSSRAAAESQSRVTGHLVESVRGMRVIQGFVRQKKNERAYGALVDRNADNHVELAGQSALYVPLLDLNSQFFLAVLLVVGGYGALNGVAGMEVGDLITFFFLANLFFQPLQHVAQLNTQAIVSMAGAERVFALLDAPPEWEDAPDARVLPDPRVGKCPGARIKYHESSRGGAAPPATVDEPASPDAPWHLPLDTCDFLTGASVEFHNVSFAYEPGRPVLHDISFTASPGQTIALVGHTGSGKTTIANLLAKFYLPAAGEIRIDGHEIRTLRGDSLRKQMGIVLQTNFLFTGTVRENIRFGRPDAPDHDVHAAAAALDCLDLIECLPAGFDTEVGERGTSLSLGQRQLICFARALLADPRILILDEATSSVDTITESRLQRALTRLLDRRTSFVVAHRLSTIRMADQILVLDQGHIVERGTHLRLLERPGRYRDLYRQFAATAGAMIA